LLKRRIDSQIIMNLKIPNNLNIYNKVKICAQANHDKNKKIQYECLNLYMVLKEYKI
jgi:hypothetical protein